MAVESSPDAQNPAESRFARTERGNQLLARLPTALRASLNPHLRRVRLEFGESLFYAHEPLRHVYFPDTGIISLLTHLNGGETLDMGLVGKDGMVGVALLPGVNMISATDSYATSSVDCWASDRHVTSTYASVPWV